MRRKKKAAAASTTGGKKRSKYSKDYTEGWVEFRDKRVAKRVAASLHNTPMGARRRSPFRYDLWNLKVRGRLAAAPLILPPSQPQPRHLCDLLLAPLLSTPFHP